MTQTKPMLTPTERAEKIEIIRHFPEKLEALVAPLTDEQLDAQPPGEWSARQNVHHLADSHMHAFIRAKLTLVEEHPTLKPYNQDDWAVTADAFKLPIASSLAILHGLHARWAVLFESVPDEGWSRTAYHPENGEMKLEDFLVSYAAHGEGHLRQIREALTATGTPVSE